MAATEGIRRDIFRQIFSQRPRRLGLRMAPMIDVIFLLLIFFLVAAKWRPEEDFMPFQLPTAGAQEQIIGKPEPLIIKIAATRAGCEVLIGRFQTVTVELNSQAMEKDLAVMMDEIRQCLVGQKRYVTDPVEIVCGPAVKWEHLAKIYNLLFGAGINDITFTMTQQYPEPNLTGRER